MDYEKHERKFIVAYETTLVEEGKEICKEVDSTSFVNNELLVEKALLYCQFISKQKNVDPKLDEKCRKYIDDVNNFNHYKSTLNKVNNERRKKESYLDMRNMILKGI